MKIIMMQQGSPEWHEFRKSHIGGSDAPAIMGVSPYKTRWELWQEKVGLKESSAPKSCMQRGSDLEKYVRAEMDEILNCSLIPTVFKHDRISYLSYSSDGYDSYSEILVEIKCGTRDEHEGVRKGLVPEKYFPQLQHALAVTGLDQIYYVSHNGGETIFTIVERDDAYIERMLEEHRKFHRCIEMLEEPEINEEHKKNVKKSYVSREDKDFKNLSYDWKLLQQSKKSIQEKEEALRKKIIESCNEQDCQGFGITVTKVKKSGHVDYSVIEVLKSVDLEKYRKESCEYWKIECK